MIVTKCCTGCHDSCAVVAYAKFCCNLVLRNWIQWNDIYINFYIEHEKLPVSVKCTTRADSTLACESDWLASPGIILCMRPANERLRNIVSLVGRIHKMIPDQWVSYLSNVHPYSAVWRGVEDIWWTRCVSVIRISYIYFSFIIYTPQQLCSFIETWVALVASECISWAGGSGTEVCLVCSTSCTIIADAERLKI